MKPVKKIEVLRIVNTDAVYTTQRVQNRYYGNGRRPCRFGGVYYDASGIPGTLELVRGRLTKESRKLTAAWKAAENEADRAATLKEAGDTHFIYRQNFYCITEVIT